MKKTNNLPIAQQAREFHPKVRAHPWTIFPIMIANFQALERPHVRAQSMMVIVSLTCFSFHGVLADVDCPKTPTVILFYIKTKKLPEKGQQDRFLCLLVVGQHNKVNLKMAAMQQFGYCGGRGYRQCNIYCCIKRQIFIGILFILFITLPVS